MEKNSTYIPPQLVVSSDFLDFGTVDPLEIEQKPRELSITITNKGGGILVGSIYPQMEWISVIPDMFKCAPGKSSQHSVMIISDFPHTSSWQNFTFDSMVFVNSNGGSLSLSGSYLAAPVEERKRLSPYWLLFPLPLITVAAFFFMIHEGMRLRNIESPTDVPAIDLLYTQAAETAIIQFTHTALAQSSIQGLSTPTAQISPNLSTTASVESTFTPEVSPTPEITFTPIPTGRFQQPEQFIYDYYEKINHREYNLAWALLTDHFQDSCCNVFGSDPYNTYVNFWNGIDSVEVLSAYLNEYNVNPVPVIVTLRYHYLEGEDVDDSRIFYLVADTELNTLLIDEVQ